MSKFSKIQARSKLSDLDKQRHVGKLRQCCSIFASFRIVIIAKMAPKASSLHRLLYGPIREMMNIVKSRLMTQIYARNLAVILEACFSFRSSFDRSLKMKAHAKQLLHDGRP